ncbi:conserved Plasmodium protein, unknown function [Plasmodium gallinaceum]|uniref:Uncharacterized protein n=1 Tax=Plasmodium gallinaceum TaxID=5849 RepID=A0A1J1H0L9_PLAGA|nr:conserved Plasmodium protein, unknown function [Plasmodium gallinaceum]CRG96829.1 conserved Plasmodium protein, unknown function [Plasmodium gallinaceum]
MLREKNEKIFMSNNFCTSDNIKIVSVMELNKIKLEGYMRNIKIENLKYLRSVETLNLSNFYLLYVYLKDIYYIFFYFIIHLNKDENILKEKEILKNYFIYNTRIENFNKFLKCLKYFISDILNYNIPLNIDEYREVLLKQSNNSNNDNIKIHRENEKKEDEIENYKSERINEKNNSQYSDYINEFLKFLYTKEQIEFFNIDELVNDRIKKDNFYEKKIRVSNNISIYKLSYLYFNDKLKRIRLDYIFHLILSKKLKDNNIKDEVVQNENLIFFYIYEQLFLLYISHFKYYIFSFFLYSYVKYIKNSNNKNNNTNQCEFLFNSDDNMKNLSSLVSYIMSFINNVLTRLSVILKKEKIKFYENICEKSEEIYNYDIINEILKTKFFFKYVSAQHIDFVLSCVILLNICNQNFMQSYFYFNNIYDHFFYVFKKYNTSINLWKELRSKNYFRFFEDLKKLSIIERFALFFNLKNIRVDYIYSILYSANNRNKFSLNVKFIDECLNFYNIKRTTYLLKCLGIQIENEKIIFNMSNKLIGESKSRCFLLDNKYECFKNFFKIYQDSIEDYIYIFYEEKIFDQNKCFTKFDIPKLICFW